MQELLERAIASWGFDVSAARSGEEALRHMDSSANWIVLLDLNLPGMDGMECFAQIRQRWPATQVILLTGFGDLDAARKAIHLDVVEFLTKPCHLGELEVAIDRAKRRLVDLSEPILPTNAEPANPPTGEVPIDGATLAELERQHIMAALARNHGNRGDTAAELGISLRTLYYRLNEYQNDGYSAD